LRVATRRDERVELWVTSVELATLTSAADVLGLDVADFIQQTALDRANRVLADLRVFHVPAEQVEAFDRLLDAPVEPNAGLLNLFSETSVFTSR
jgi:uncharacterized protein (DUF1778 family)